MSLFKKTYFVCCRVKLPNRKVVYEAMIVKSKDNLKDLADQAKVLASDRHNVSSDKTSVIAFNRL
jgi:hypothetical protein